MNVIKRNSCVISGKNDLEHMYSFKKFPVFMGCMDQSLNDDLKADMDWSIGRESGMIQLEYLLPLDVLYPESHGAGAVGGLWDKHHKALAKFLAKVKPSAVLEIGGAHGILSKEYNAIHCGNIGSNAALSGDITNEMSEKKPIPWTIIEPNPSPIEDCKARFIKGFFDEKFIYDDPFDVVVHSHVFEHIYEPNEFMTHLENFIEEGKYLVFSLPNMQVMLERKYTNCINFEHTVFLSEVYVEFLLAKHGFKLVEKEYFMNDHSIFYAAIRDKSVKSFELPKDLYQKNKKLYLDYVAYHEELIKDLNQKIQQTSSPVYLFGAHVFAQYLIAFGLDTTKIVNILDNDVNKQGKRLYGTNLEVKSPKVLKDVEKPAVILKAGVYNNEIKEDILGNINKDVIFFE